MENVKDKLLTLTINKMKVEKNSNELLNGLHILLNGNYQKYNLNDVSKVSDINELADDNFQRIMFNLNEKTNKRKDTGVYYTPVDVTRYIITNVFLMKTQKNLNKTHNTHDGIEKLKKLENNEKENLLFNYKVFDPTCGSGEFLINALNIKLNLLKQDEISDKNILNICKTIYGNDIDDESTDISKIRIYIYICKKLRKTESYIKLANIINERFSNKDFVIDYNNINEKFDIIIGNPPYVEYSKFKRKNEIKNKFGNIYADVLKNSFGLSNNNATIGYIIPISYVSTPRMKEIREYIINNSCKQIVLNFADRPDCLFSGVHQKLTILIAQKGKKNNDIYSSNYTFWYKNERNRLLNGREVMKLDNIDVENGFYKIGNKIEKDIFNKVYNSKQNFITSQISDGKPIYLNMRATFWIKAFSFNPGSKEYKEFKYGENNYYLILAILNSSLFWLFWTMVSDCWHITGKEQKLFYIPDIDYSENNKMKKLCENLENQLEKTKKYIGSKQTDYEYKHRLCKEQIDNIDDELGKIYKLTNDEVNYIKNFSLLYRMSGEKNDKNN